jgi:hypothetical protein
MINRTILYLRAIHCCTWHIGLLITEGWSLSAWWERSRHTNMSTTNPTWPSAVRDRRTSLRQGIIIFIAMGVQSFEKADSKWSNILLRSYSQDIPSLLWNVYTPELFINMIFSTYYFMSVMVTYFPLTLFKLKKKPKTKALTFKFLQ